MVIENNKEPSIFKRSGLRPKPKDSNSKEAYYHDQLTACWKLGNYQEDDLRDYPLKREGGKY
jgi:hypothetical protein